MLIQMVLRRGTTSEWTTANPILASGELALDTSQSKFKIGDGVTAWNSLAFATGTAGSSGLNPVFSRQGTLTTLVGTQRLYIERTGTISVVRASIGTPSVGSAVVVDVNKNGTSILSSPISVAAGQYTATGTISNTSVVAGDYLTVDIDAVGSTSPGANLTATVYIL
jgi:hypothetical protein